MVAQKQVEKATKKIKGSIEASSKKGAVLCEKVTWERDQRRSGEKVSSVPEMDQNTLNPK
jgi:hypothetical protein